METLEQLKEIVKNAPEIATHIDFNGHYWHNSSAFYWLCCDDGSTTSNADIGNHIRKLSDIKHIIELMEGQKKAYQAYVALEEIKQKYNSQNKIAKAMLRLAYDCDEFALPADLRKDIKNFLGDL